MYSLCFFFFFSFPFLYCVDWIFFCWFESYIFLWLLLTYLAPYLTSLLSWVLRVSAPSCLSLLSSPALVLWHLQGGFCSGTAALFLCHLAQNWARLLQGSPGRDSPAQQEQEVLCTIGGWWVPRRREQEDGALRALPQGWEPQTFWSSSTVCLWDFYSLLPASLSDAVQNGVPQPTKGGKQMRGGSLGKMIGRVRD